MKIKNTLALLLLTALAFIPINANAANKATITITPSSTQVIVGNQISVRYTISSSIAIGAWDFQVTTPSNFKFKSCSEGSGVHIADAAANASTKYKTVTCYFVAKSSGSGTFSVKNVEILEFKSGNRYAVTTLGKTVKTLTQAQLEASYSKNNNLKSLSVTGATLDTKFSSSDTEYSVEVPAETKKIKINATKADSKAKISGTGTKTVSEGLNKFNIVVTAENGNKKTYVLNVTVKELEPIEVTVEGQTLTLVQKKENLTQPNSLYVEKTITIDNKKIPAYYNEITNYTLVGLKNDSGNINYYLYDETNDSYTLYQEIKFNQLIVQPIAKMDNIPDNFSKFEETINEEKMTVYKLSASSDYALFNAINMETGITNLYRYDKLENTIQRYTDEEAKVIEDDFLEKEKIYEYVILGCVGFLLLTYFVLFISLFRKAFRKKKKEIVIERYENLDEIKSESEEKTTINHKTNNKGKKKKKRN